jgi:DNA-binding transcriptional ArsR family regulator
MLSRKWKQLNLLPDAEPEMGEEVSPPVVADAGASCTAEPAFAMEPAPGDVGERASPPIARRRKERPHIGRPLAEYLVDGRAKKPNVIVPHLLYEGRCTLYVGKPKLGKTTAAAWLASQLACGGSVFGAQSRRMVVLWFALEEHPDDAAGRLAAMGAGAGVFLSTTLACPGGILKGLEENLQELRPDVVVIDTLSALAKASGDVNDENNATAMSALVQAVSDLAHASGSAVLIIHHSRKNDSGYRGSTAIGAAVDIVVEMSEVRNADAEVRRLESLGRLELGRAVFHVRFDPERAEYTAVADVDSLSEDARSGTATEAPPVPDGLSERVLVFLRKQQQASLSEIRLAIKGRAQRVDNALSALVDGGRVVRLRQGNRHVYSVAA